MRKFELLKDICGPQWNVKAGSIFEKVGKGEEHGAYSNGNYHLHPSYIENNPEWFREIVEKEPFVWDDDKVADALAQFAIQVASEKIQCEPYKFIGLFKASQNFDPTIAKKIYDKYIKAGSGTANDVQNLDEYIEKWGKSPSKPLNSEWEIVEFRRKGNIYRKMENVWRSQRNIFDFTQEELLEDATIYSVKRLSDV